MMAEFLICIFCGHAWVTYSWTRADDCHECGHSLAQAVLVRRVEGEPEDSPGRTQHLSHQQGGST